MTPLWYIIWMTHLLHMNKRCCKYWRNHAWSKFKIDLLFDTLIDWNMISTFFEFFVLHVQCKGRHTRGDRSQGSIAGTGPGDQVPACKQANFHQKSGRRDWFLVPEIGPTNSNQFEFVGPVAGTGPRNHLLGHSCEQARGTGPCDQLKMNQSMISICSDAAFQENAWHSVYVMQI